MLGEKQESFSSRYFLGATYSILVRLSKTGDRSEKQIIQSEEQKTGLDTIDKQGIDYRKGEVEGEGDLVPGDHCSSFLYQRSLIGLKQEFTLLFEFVL